MVFAYILCIILGLIVGSFQILRRNIIGTLGDGAYGNDLTDEERALSVSSLILITLVFPVYVAIFYANPWVIVDNFVAGREGVIVVQFSIFKLITFLAFLVIGEVVAIHYHSHEFKKKQAQYKNYASPKPEYKYDPDMMVNWRKWRRAHANSGHPDWVPPGAGPRKETSSTGTYIEPKRQKAMQTLGLKYGTSLKEVHRQYLKMAKRYHPDKVLHSGASPAVIEQAEEKMAEINAAYDWLKSNS